jgi:iron complex transport system ATP-binding protein
LVKNKYDVVVGVLHKNDTDYFIAKPMELTIIEEEAYDKISEKSFGMALNELKYSDVVVYSDFPVGEMNKLNIQLIEEAKKYRKTIIQYNGDISVLKNI